MNTKNFLKKTLLPLSIATASLLPYNEASAQKEVGANVNKTELTKEEKKFRRKAVFKYGYRFDDNESVYSIRTPLGEDSVTIHYDDITSQEKLDALGKIIKLEYEMGRVKPENNYQLGLYSNIKESEMQGSDISYLKREQTQEEWDKGSIRVLDYFRNLKNDVDYEKLIDVVDHINYAQLLVHGSGLTYQSDSANYGDTEYFASGLETALRKKGDCDDGALFFASLYQDKGLKPYLLELTSDREEAGHLVMVYKDKETGNFGTMGINPSDINAPLYKSLSQLVNNEFKWYVAGDDKIKVKFKVEDIWEPITKDYVDSPNELTIYKPYYDQKEKISQEILDLYDIIQNN